MATIHEVLRWSNRTAVAAEITRRGYRVSGETLNRWYRQRSEVPAVVEHIVFDLFGIGASENAPMPEWARGLENRLTERLSANRSLIEALARPELLEAAERVIERLEALGPPDDATPNGSGAAGGPAVAMPRDREPG